MTGLHADSQPRKEERRRPPVPSHPTDAKLDSLLTPLWSELTNLGAEGREDLLLRRGLLLPASQLLAHLATCSKQKAVVPAQLALLGPRGAYLMSLATQSPYSSDDFLAPSQMEAAFAKTEPDKLLPERLAFALGVAGARGLPHATRERFRVLLKTWIEAGSMDGIHHTYLLQLLDDDQLTAKLGFDTALDLLVHRDQLPSSWRTQQLMLATQVSVAEGTPAPQAADVDQGPTGGDDHDGATLKPFEPFSPTLSAAFEARSEAAVALLASNDLATERDLDPASFETLSLAAHMLQASSTAATLFGLTITSKNKLLSRHPALAICLDAMDPEDYARSVSAFVEAAPTGWHDAMLPTLLSTGPHPLSPADSEHLALDLLRHYGFGAKSLARRFALKLHPETIAVIHAFDAQQTPRDSTTGLATVLAKAAELNRLYPAHR